jgi:succinoglycan biosynthesis protein ExoO
MSSDTLGPQLSVIMPAFNAGHTIARAVNSVLAQDLDGLEVIVVDDGSTDDTVAWVYHRALADPRLRLLRQLSNQGPAAARNVGLNVARGRWVGLLDADDAWLPGRARRLVLLGEEYGVDVVADNQWLYDAPAKRMVRKGFTLRTVVQPFTMEDLLRNDISGGLFVFGWLKPVMRRAFLESHALRYLSHLRYGEDFNLYVRIFGAGARGLLTGEAMYIYTQRTGSISRTRSGYSRTSPNIEALSEDMGHLLKQLRPGLSPRAVRLMQRRADHLDNWPNVMLTRDLVRRHAYLKALGVLVARPACLHALLLAMYTRFRQRLGFV